MMIAWRPGSMSLSSTRAGLSSANLGGPSTPVVSVPLRLPAYDDRRAKGLRDAYLPRVLRKPPGEPVFCNRPARRCITNFGRRSTEFLPLYPLVLPYHSQRSPMRTKTLSRSSWPGFFDFWPPQLAASLIPNGCPRLCRGGLGRSLHGAPAGGRHALVGATGCSRKRPRSASTSARRHCRTIPSVRPCVVAGAL
jgi:hypothetical protein